MERYDFRTQRLFLEADLREGGVVEIDRAQSNYLLNVLRLKTDDAILVFNGRDGEWLANISPTGRKSCNLTLQKQTRKQPPPYDLIYLFAPLKQGRLDYMTQKAVEMGAGTLQPVLTQYTQITKLKTERIKTNAIEAVEQCGILSMPEIKEPVKLHSLLEDWDTSRQIIFCDEAAELQSGKESLADLKDKPIAVLIGPEGGFSTQEREVLLGLPFVSPISLGPRILRADTAAVAALALVQATIGDWAE